MSTNPTPPRIPVDGVPCVVWTKNGSAYFVQWSEKRRRWTTAGLIVIDPEQVTHWTTLAECRAAPAMVEALEWYSNPRIYDILRQSTVHPNILDEGEAYQDAGERARTALDSIKEQP